jgi:hypothetical protein
VLPDNAGMRDLAQGFGFVAVDSADPTEINTILKL